MKINPTSTYLKFFHIWKTFAWFAFGLIIALTFYAFPRSTTSVFGIEVTKERPDFSKFLIGFYMIYTLSGLVYWSLYRKLFKEYETLKIKEDKSAE